MLKLEYFFHLKPLLAAQFLDMKLPGLWHLDRFPSISFSWAAKTCFERMALAGQRMRCGDAVSFLQTSELVYGDE